jgi:hypothetical protein
MIKTSMSVSLALLILSGSARSQETVPASDAGPVAAQAGPGAPSRKMQVGLSVLPMLLGRANDYLDFAPAYGVGLSWGYFVMRGLSIGVAPQAIFDIKLKNDASSRASTEYDFMARAAYVLPVLAKLAAYGELLGGYSIISPAKGDSSRGLVYAFGAGGIVDAGDRAFVVGGGGYQWGWQTISVDGISFNHNTRFLRIALGAGLRF